MEEASKAKKAKKGFMTPERKKKLRVGQSIDYQLNFIPNLTFLVPFFSCCCARKPLRN